ncbi:hypothetical protein HY406_01845, partial [Candidatus Giovannonibacteria bacterium]|nr:hypothetical protein [Candidatus Giovannonibacteria bacterium]
ILEKIDATHAKRIETKDQVEIIDIDQLRKRKTEIEQEVAKRIQEHAAEVARLNSELTKISEVITAFELIP